MDVLFLFPPAPDNPGRFVSHLGAAYLQAALAKNGIVSRQWIDRRPGSVGAVARKVARCSPRVVGFTTYDENLSLAIALAEALRTIHEDWPIVFGGPGVLYGAQTLLERHRSIDACFRGEAEEAGPDLFAAFFDSRRPDFTGIPGVTWRGSDGAIVDNGVAPLVRGPDPNAALDIAVSPYLEGVLDDPQAGVLTGRGCNQHCAFCCFAALSGRRIRLHSDDRILAELEIISHLARRRVLPTPIQIFDDTFSLQPERAKRLCARIAGQNLNLRLSCITRADKVDAELLGLMSAAGVRAVAFGLESAVPRVLRVLGKVRPPDSADPLVAEEEYLARVRKAVGEAKSHGLAVGVSVIVGAPGETARDAAATIRFVEELGVDYYLQNPLRLYRGTPLWDERERCGLGIRLDLDGVPETIGHAYDVSTVRPAAHCIQLQELDQLRWLSAGTLFACRSPLVPPAPFAVVVLRVDTVSEALAQWLACRLAIGGFILVVRRDRDRARAEMDRQTLVRHRVPARQVVALLPGSDEGCLEMFHPLAGSGEAIDPKLIEVTVAVDGIPLRRWLAGGPAGAGIYEPEVVLAEGSLPALTTAARQRSGDEPPPCPAYPGRFTAGTAACAGLSRVEIDSEGWIRVCRYVDPIGTIGEPESVLRQRHRQRLAGDGWSGGCPVFSESCAVFGAEAVSMVSHLLELTAFEATLGARFTPASDG